MSLGLIDTSILTGIANAIRTKLGVQTQYKPGQMATAIGQISSGGITPTGTKQVSITQNGTTTEDVTNYANVEINTNVVNQDYVDALTALGVQSDLADSITALTTYANGITGQSDTDLSDAVHTLGSGYGGGSVEEETGTYIPEQDELPTINFSNSHTKEPSIVVFIKTNTSGTMPNNCGTFFAHIKTDDILGVSLQTGASLFRNNLYMQAHTGSTGSTTLGAAANTGGSNNPVITSAGFTPYFSSPAFICRTGNTYKWIAIWK